MMQIWIELLDPASRLDSTLKERMSLLSCVVPVAVFKVGFHLLS